MSACCRVNGTLLMTKRNKRLAMEVAQEWEPRQENKWLISLSRAINSKYTQSLPKGS